MKLFRRRVFRQASLLLLLAGCSRRPHVGASSVDAGPSVVMVARQVPAQPSRMQGIGGSEVQFVDEKEPNDDLASAQIIEYPKGVRGRIAAAGDVDLYKWTAVGEGRQALRVELSDDVAPAVGGGAASVSGALVVEVREEVPAQVNGGPVSKKAEALAVGEAASEGVLVISNLGLDADKSYVVAVRVKPPASVAVPGIAYRLILRSSPLGPGDEEEPNDNLAHANLLAAGVEETGYAGKSHDEDWLKLPVELPDAGTLRIELAAPEGVAMAIKLRDAAGTILAEARAGKGEELRLRNAAMAPGGALVLKAESGKNVDDKWTLRLGAEPVLSGAESEPNGTVATANRVLLDGTAGTISGFLWPGDGDVFRLHATMAGAVRVEVSPPEGVDLKLERLSEQGSVLLKVDEAGPGKRERLPLLSLAGGDGSDLFVRVLARPHDTAFDAPYTLSWSMSVPDGGVAR